MDFSSIFNGEALTMEQFAEKTKGMKLADLSTGAYVAKGKYDEDLKSAQSALEEAKKTVAALETNANNAPGKLQPVGDDSFTHIIMPMHIG